ncbi:MAG: hypothetical protein KF819_16695 [Labilithrix sp.]|nr:hypothetical protein [Labilithrix sp.]
MADPETETRTEGGEPPGAADAQTDKVPSVPPARAPSVPAQAAAKPASVPPHRPSRPSGPLARTPGEGGPLGAYEALARSARLPDLVAIAQKVLGEAASSRPSEWMFMSKVSLAADDAKLPHGDAETPFGNALTVLGSGPDGAIERALASALHAHAIAEAPRDDEEHRAAEILWLATHTAFDATPLLDRALGDEARETWRAIGDRIVQIDAGKGASLARGEAIAGCAALMASTSAEARAVAADIASKVKDPTLVHLLAGATGDEARELRLEGEAIAPPRGPVLTAILALSGLLFAAHAVRLVARLALAYKRPAEVSLTANGVRMKTRTEMLGRTLREREHVIVRAGLMKVVREVRYPRAAFYAGLLALALGSYVGVRAFSDGVRAASPSLLLTGLVIVALGIAADFVLGSVLPGARGRCRVAFVPRSGPELVLADVDAKRADDALARTLRSR